MKCEVDGHGAHPEGKDCQKCAVEVYGALSERDWRKVKYYCKAHPKGPFLTLTKNRESVLQKALYATQGQLVLDLLNDAEERWAGAFFKYKLQHDVTTRGDTILHVAATHDDCMPAVRKIIDCLPELLHLLNEKNESPLFNAVRYGQVRMFQFLDEKYIEKFGNDAHDHLSYYQAQGAKENYNILHVAIRNEHYELGLYIATTYPTLICQENHNKMTSLHLLAMNPSAFNAEDWKWHVLLFPCPFPSLAQKMSDKDATDDDFKSAAAREVLPEDAREANSKDDAVESVCSKMRIPCWKRNRKAYRSYRAASLLGSFLVKKDTNWIEELVTSDSRSRSDDEEVEDYTGTRYALNMTNANSAGGAPTNPADNKKLVVPPTPLALATKFGCTEIALNIIKIHPHTVEQTNPEGSVLHLAIRYRRKEIIEAILKLKMQMRKLVRWNDQDGNSILHMVALNTPKVIPKNGTNATLDWNSILQVVALNIPKLLHDGIDATLAYKPKAEPLQFWEAEVPIDETRSPAFELQDDLLLFERVEDILKANHHKSPNNNLQTPDQLFAEKKEELRNSAQEYMKRTAENCSLVAVLIATVAFAAAYTVPGGNDDQSGSPILLGKTFFIVFTIADVLSLASTLTAIVVFLSILTSPFRFQDFKATLPRSLMFGIGCLIFSLAMMMLAFAATIILMIKNKQEWTRIALYTVAFLPVTMLIATYLPFYGPLKKTFYYTKQKLMDMLPGCGPDDSYTSIQHTPPQEAEKRRQCSCLFV